MIIRPSSITAPMSPVAGISAPAALKPAWAAIAAQTPPRSRSLTKIIV